MRKETSICTDGLDTKKRSYKLLALILAAVLLLGGVVSGTLAWLISKTEPVVNTFTYGDIDLTLDETKLDGEGNTVDLNGDQIPDRTSDGNDYEMVPGEEFLKDPIVTVGKGNEACWLFIKLEETGGVTITNADGSTTSYAFDDYLTYAVADGWIQLLDSEEKAAEGIYFRFVEEDTENIETPYEILGYYDEEANFVKNKIKVKDTVTKEMLNLLDNNGQNAENAAYPKLAITAYAIQYSGFEPEINEDAETPTAEQVNAAALLAWQAIEEQNMVSEP